MKVLMFMFFSFTCFLLFKAALHAFAAHEAKQTIVTFYQYESEGKFADSWELFHPLMKEKFNKSYYIQDRSHVFMSHFGAATFSFSLSRMSKVNQWAMNASAEPFQSAVYKTTVTKQYEGKYGKFQFVQDVFAAKEDGRWTVLWDYNF